MIIYVQWMAGKPAEDYTISVYNQILTPQILLKINHIISFTFLFELVELKIWRQRNFPLALF